MAKGKKTSDIEKFKVLVKEKMAQVDWVKVSTLGFAVLLVLGAKGVFGPKVRIAAILIIKSTAV